MPLCASLMMQCQLRNILRVAVCFVMVLAFSGQHVWGSCGDHLEAPFGSSGNPSRHVNPGKPIAPVKSPICAGLRCHRGDSVPAIPFEIPDSSGSRDAALSDVVALKNTAVAGHWQNVEVIGRDVFENRIFRPPRIG